MNYEIFIDDISTINIDNKTKRIIATINPHSYVVAKGDNNFNKALHESDILLPDGSGIVLAAKYINKTTIQRITGSDLHLHLLSYLNNKGGKCFYLGSSQATLNKIHQKIAIEFPNIKVGIHSPPFKKEFSEKDNETSLEKINTFKPDVLFIGMTAPKQEKWIEKHKQELSFKIAAPIGAVFDFYAETVPRSSVFWINLHLEWLPRLLKEPKRLWKRNFVSSPLFLLEMMLFKLGIKK